MKLSKLYVKLFIFLSILRANTWHRIGNKYICKILLIIVHSTTLKPQLNIWGSRGKTRNFYCDWDKLPIKSFAFCLLSVRQIHMQSLETICSHFLVQIWCPILLSRVNFTCLPLSSPCRHNSVLLRYFGSENSCSLQTDNLIWLKTRKSHDKGIQSHIITDALPSHKPNS